MKPKFICMVAYTDFDSDNRVRQEADALSQRKNYRVAVIVPQETEKKEQRNHGPVEIIQLQVRKYQGKSNLRYFVSYILFSLQALFVLNRMLLQSRLDVVHFHNMPDFIVFAALVPRLLGKKVVLDIHDTMFETYMAKFPNAGKLFQYILILEERISCKFADVLICVNDPQKERIIERGIPEEKIFVCMNLPDLNKFQKKPGADNYHDDSFKLIYHGTQTKRLGVDVIIRAVAKLVEQIPTIKLFLIGEGDDLDEFLDLSRSLGLENHIYFSRKNIAIDKLIEIIPAMDLGVVANRKNIATELMLPVKLLEYLALEVPVIVSKLKTVSYYFDDSMVVFFEPGNIEDLSQKILQLFKDSQRRQKQTAQAIRFFENYQWGNHKKVLLGVYDNFK